MSKPRGVLSIRDKLDLFFKPFVLFFSKFGIKANHITLLQAIPALISFWYILRGSYLLGAIFLAIALLLDVLDGSWARITQNITNIGHLLDKLLDIFGIYIFLLAVFIAEPSLIAIIIGLGLVNAFLYLSNEFLGPEFYCGVRTFGLIGLLLLNLKIMLLICTIIGILMLIVKALKFYFRKKRQVV